MQESYSIFSILLTILGLFPDFKPMEYNAIKESGGIAGSRNGIIYTICIKSKTSSAHLQFDYLYVDGFQIPIKILSANGASISNFQKKDTFTIQAARLKEELPGHEANGYDLIKADFPIPYTGKALLSYQLNGRQQYLKIQEFKVLQVVKP